MWKLDDPWDAAEALRGRNVLVAMSGGVDSSVAALVLQRRGARVIGLTMKNFCYSEAGAGARSCCSTAHMVDARGVCDALGVPHHVVDTSAAFGRAVMDRFVAEYRAGRTPNPCVDCNRSVRFPRLIDAARELGADLVATGHYARIGRDASGSFFIRRAHSQAKDQSYFLHGVPERCLERTVFPLGDLEKEVVRALAHEAGLPVAEKPESQEICFLPDGDRASFLAERDALEPGPIVDFEGRELGRHAGIGLFTIGQRRGLGLATGRPLYVHHIEPETQSVVLAEGAALESGGLEADSFWLRVDAGRPDLTVQVRYRHPGAPVASLEVEGARARLRFASPERAVAPGQAAVLYAGDAVVGGGRIVATFP
jgi:tRNA-specific 2-thiouridylase